MKFDTLKVVVKLDVPENFRLSRVIYKKGKESLGALVPIIEGSQIEAIFALPEGQNLFIEALEKIQDRIARIALDSSSEINWDEVAGPEKIIEFLKSESESIARLSKESIQNWFNSDMKPVLINALAAKGLNDKATLETLMVFSAHFSNLAGKEKNINMPEKIKVQLLKALDLFPENYEAPAVLIKMMEKLENSQEERTIENAL